METVAVDSPSTLEPPLLHTPNFLTTAEPPKKRGRRKQILKELQQPLVDVAVPTPMPTSSGSGGCDPGAAIQLLAVGPLAHDAQVQVPTPMLAVSSAPSREPRVAASGFAVLSTCAAEFADLLKKVSPQDDLDPDYEELSQAYLYSGKNFHVTSLTVKSAELSMSRWTLQRKLWRLMCSQTLAARINRLLLDAEVVSRFRDHCVCYIDHNVYDETPMIASIKADTLDPSCPKPNDPDADPDALAFAAELDSALWTHSKQCKFLQSSQKFAMLISMPHKKTYLKITGDIICPLQIMANTSTAVLHRCLQLHAGPSNTTNQFSVKMRSCCTDKAPSNTQAELKMIEQRDSGWQGLHVACEAHIIATICKRTFPELLPQLLHGMLHTALSLRSSSAFQLFRRSLRLAIQARLVIKHGAPSLAAREYRKICLRTFFGSCSASDVQRMLIFRLPNGDWRNHAAVEHYPGPSGVTNKVDIAKVMEAGITFALCLHQPALYVAHRWTGADAACDHLCQLECIHGLLTHTIHIFMDHFSKSATSDVNMDTEIGMHAQEQFHTHQAPGAADPGTVLDVVALPLQAPQGSEGPVDEAHRSSAMHSKDRKIAKDFVNSKPFGKMVILRLALKPIMTLLYKQFKVTSIEEELKQRAQVATASLSGDSLGERVPERDYSLTIASSNKHEMQLFDDLMELFFDSPGWWSLIPSDDLTVANNALAFQVLTRLGALVQYKLVDMHDRFPMCLFGLLLDQSKAEALSNRNRCLMDPWSSGLLEKYGKFSHPEVLEILRLQAQVATTNISQVESRHGSNRRVLQQRSVQTWPVQVPTMSAEWVAQCLRTSITSSLHVGHHHSSSRTKSTSSRRQVPSVSHIPAQISHSPGGCLHT